MFFATTSRLPCYILKQTEGVPNATGAAKFVPALAASIV
jgi:hypothetical protein